MPEKELHRYFGKEFNVFWNEPLCIHIEECLRAPGGLFIKDRLPWCKPDCVPAKQAAEIIERCPTGSLTCHAKDGTLLEQPAMENSILVSYNGPFFARGDLSIEGADETKPGVKFRAALCRCGQSKNKPFCDNSHECTHFHDYGAVGEQGPGLKKRGGTLRIKPLPGGPLAVSGNLTILSSSGRTAWEGCSAALCQCGASRKKPFCDGSHKQ